MLDIKFIRQNPDKVKEACRKKQVKVDIDKALELDEKSIHIVETLHYRTMRQLHHKLYKDLLNTVFLYFAIGNISSGLAQGFHFLPD